MIIGDLVKQHSRIIATKLETLVDTEDARLHMPECSASHFKLFVSFIYTGKIYTATDKENATEWRLLCELWILGQALESTTLKDAVTDAMIERGHMHSTYHSDAYTELAKHLQTTQQTRKGVGKFLVGTAVCRRAHTIYTDERSTSLECLNFYGEVLRGLNRIRCGIECEWDVLRQTDTGANCVYHEHCTGGVCHKKMFPAARDSLRQPIGAMSR